MPGASLGWLYGRQTGMRHRLLAWPVALLIVVALHGAAALFVVRLQPNNAPEVYYAPGTPAVLVRDALRADFPSDEVLTVVFRGKDLYGADFLARLRRVEASLSNHPLVDRVTSVLSMERIAGTADGFAVEPLIDGSRLGRENAESLRQRVMADRFAPGLLASRDGSILALAVRPKPLTASAQRLALKIAVASAINEAGLRPYYAGDAGPVTLDVAQLTSILDDTMLFVPLTGAIGLALLAWVVGRLRPVVIGAVAMSTVVLPTVAAIAAAGKPYTMAAAILPSLLAAYTLATLLHLYAAVQRAQIARLRVPEAVDRAIGETLRPGAFNVLTTGAGLLSLVLVPLPPIQVFGVAGALGTLLVFVTVYFLVPSFLVHWDRGGWPQRKAGMGHFGRIASRLAIASMRRPKVVVLSAVAILFATLPLLRQVEVESDVLAFFAADHPVSRDTKLIESRLAGVTSLEISVRGDGRDSLQNLQVLRALRDLQRWLESLPEVDRTVSMADLVEQMHWAMNGEQPRFRALPGNDRLLRQYLLVYDGDDLYELVNRDFSHARVVLNLNIHGATQIGRTIVKIRDHLATHAIPGATVEIGGHGRLFADQVGLLVQGQLNSFAGAFAQIFLFMALLWRSPVAAALCLAPNLAPLYFNFVLMGATGIHLDLATVMIASVVLGITVDDTIHLYHGYRHRRQRGISPIFAIARSFESSGRAVLAISVLLVAQFMLLATSNFIPTANFGLMTAVGLVAGQAAELVLLPALLVLKDGRKRPAAIPVGGQALPGTPTGHSSRDGAGGGAPVATETAWAPTEVWSQPGAGAGAPEAAPQVAETCAGAAAVARILVCEGPECAARGSRAIRQRLDSEKAALEERHVIAPGIRLTTTSCLGPCERAPVVQVYPEGRYFSAPDVPRLVQSICNHLAMQSPRQSTNN